MHRDIDRYSRLSSPVHRWDSRLKLVTVLGIIVAISFIERVAGGLAALAVSAAFFLLSRIPARFILKKTVYPLLFLVPLLVILPLTYGSGPTDKIQGMTIYRNGIELGGIILLKTVSILTLFLTSLATSPISRTFASLRHLRLPGKLVEMILFTYRYLNVFTEDIRRMRTALTLRGYRNRNQIHTLRTSASLAATLLIRSYEQADRVRSAMILRGYTGTLPLEGEFSVRRGDLFTVLAGFIAAILIIWIDRGGIPL